MKKTIGFALMMLLLGLNSYGQEIMDVNASKNSVMAKKSGNDEVVRLNNSASYLARTDQFSIRENYTISDPLIRSLNLNANGADIRISNSGIAGMPKRAYGFANGRLWLVNTTATSSGTITGNESIGSGSSLGSLGSKGPHMGINGKSPYSGSNMWGNARGMVNSNPDASIRQMSSKTDND